MKRRIGRLSILFPAALRAPAMSWCRRGIVKHLDVVSEKLALIGIEFSVSHYCFQDQ